MWNSYHYPPCFDTADKSLASFHPQLSEPDVSSVISNSTGSVNRKWESITHKFLGISKSLITYQANPKRRHRTVPNAFGLSSSKDIRRFTRRDKELVQFLEDNKILKVLNVQSKSLGTTRAFMLTDEMRTALENFFSELSISEDKIIRPEFSESGISDLTSKDKIRRSAIQIPRWVSVDVNGIKEGLKQCDKEDKSLLQLTYGTAKSFDGFLRQDYVESPFGRLYGRRSFESLQLMPKRLLKYIIPNSFVYDIKASSFSLMSQITKIHNPSVSTKAIEEYINNRSSIRHSIADSLGVDYELIKQCFTALGFGARRITHSWREKGSIKTGAIRDILGSAELTIEFLVHPLVQSITDEMDECSEVMLNSSPKDLSLIGSRNQKVAYIYQNEEVRVLQSMVSSAIELGCSIKSMKHDAIVVNHQLPIELIQSRVYEDTGFWIRLEEEMTDSY